MKPLYGTKNSYLVIPAKSGIQAQALLHDSEAAVMRTTATLLTRSYALGLGSRLRGNDELFSSCISPAF
jgi:hypothetical protein